jgi:hypothetical protein
MTAQHPIHQIDDCWVRLVQTQHQHHYRHQLHHQKEKQVGPASPVINQHIAGYQVVMTHCEANGHASWQCHLFKLLAFHSKNHVTLIK